MSKNWYRFVNFRLTNDPHGAEWSIAVDRQYVDAVEDRIDPEVVRKSPESRGFKVVPNRDLPHWLGRVGVGNPSGPQLFLNFSDRYDGVDPEHERVYSVGNCRDIEMSYALLNEFNLWARMVEDAHET